MAVFFTENEKKAMASVLYALAKADYRAHDTEHQTLSACLDEMDFHEEGFQPIPRSQLEVGAYMTLKEMNKEKKRAFSLMMMKIARSDGNFGPLERAFVKEILEMCEIPFVHK